MHRGELRILEDFDLSVQQEWWFLWKYIAMRKYLLLIPALATLLLASGCGSSSSSSTSSNAGQSITWGIELWGDNFQKTSNGHCTEAPSGGNYENNDPISLVGPDGSEVSSATLSFGVLTKSRQDPKNVTNFPTGDICAFTVTFLNIPSVATYRVKTRDGQIDPVSHSRTELVASNWSVFELIGANFKQ